ncbi:MAG: calycin-like domain-containing protein [Bacteroidales bacterium]|nr:calycin-like domain-containing protein [Bacteroidales bacterium]
MKKIYTLLFGAMIACFAFTANALTYQGTLVINMMGATINEGDETVYTVEVSPTSAGLCDFTLANFSLDLGDGPVPLGDIYIEDVTTSTTDGVTTYSGSKDGLTLAEGEIVANVTLTGTDNADGEAVFNIDVMWIVDPSDPSAGQIPIYVTFTGQRTSGINSLTNHHSSLSTTEYYNLQGIRVNSPVKGQIYIARTADTVAKIVY